MASVNDNLFTTLTVHALSQKGGLRTMTRWGLVRAKLTEDGLSELCFDDNPRHQQAEDTVIRDTFLSWLANYQAMNSAQQWRCLAPNGTDFQQKVWRALLEIPLGETSTYGQLAAKIGQASAARAVGSAVGANPICLLIPCHRVIHADGRIGNYRWGADRKLALLDAERTSGSDLLQLFQ